MAKIALSDDALTLVITTQQPVVSTYERDALVERRASLQDQLTTETARLTAAIADVDALLALCDAHKVQSRQVQAQQKIAQEASAALAAMAVVAADPVSKG